jgi:hypothetical protein
VEKTGNQLRSRRHFLQHTASLAGIAIVSMTFMQDAAAAKLSKASVHYQPHLKGKPDCDDCTQYIAPGSGKRPASCKRVEGDINPHGWCELFEAKA